MKKVLLVFALLLVIVGGILFTKNYLNKTSFFFLKKTPTAIINNQAFELRVANTQKEKEIGLSETRNLPQDHGMIFLFERSDYYSFWMKNMTIPLDIIYINKDEIVTIQNNVQPPKNPIENPIIYIPSKPSDKVLEINAGLSEKYNFKNGDKVNFHNL